MHIKLLLLFFASNLAIVDSHIAIGKNCSLEQLTLPPSGFHYQLEGCPSSVNFEAPNLCLVPDARCSEGCPGLCDENQASMEYCIISFTCIWRLVPDNDNPKTTTPPPTDTGLTKGSLISIIVSVAIVVLVLILVLIWFFVFKKRYGRLTDENLNVTYRVDEEISFNMSRSLTNFA